MNDDRTDSRLPVNDEQFEWFYCSGVCTALSVGTLFPHTFVPNGLQYAADIAREAGYFGLHLLPFWTYSFRELKALSETFPVVSFKGSCNHMSFDARTTWERLKELDVGTIRDTMLFGSEDRVEQILTYFYELFPDAMSINTDPTGIREMSPYYNTSRVDWLEYEGGVVVDTYHIYEFSFIRDETDAARFAEALLDAGSVAMVHIQVRDKWELENFLSGRESSLETSVLAVMASLNISLPIVVEIHPKILPLLRKGRMEILSAVRKRIGSFFGE